MQERQVRAVELQRAHARDDTLARRDWGWKHAYDLEAMVDDLMPKMRALVASARDLPVHA